MDGGTQAPAEGIHMDISNEEYHAGPGVSRSTLWALNRKTPAAVMYGEPKETKALTMGSAIDAAVTDPHGFEAVYIRGPGDRRGNAWKNAATEAEEAGLVLLTSGDYDAALRIRDAVLSNATAEALLTPEKTILQASAYWIDPLTGLLCKVRPDIARPDLKILVDLKSAADASEWTWAKAASDYGYHAQDAFYCDGWEAAGGGEIDGMVFIVVEKEPPYQIGLYEFEPTAVDEGRAAMRRGLDLYYQCQESGEWPGYPEHVQRIDIPRFAYRLTPAPGSENAA